MEGSGEFTGTDGVTQKGKFKDNYYDENPEKKLEEKKNDEAIKEE